MADKRPIGKLGMDGFPKEAIKLKFGNYISKLPTLPQYFGHARNWPRDWWGMGANDKYGCCVIAGAGHETRYWHAVTGRPLPSFSDDTISEQYLALTGGKDEGLDPVATAKWRQKVGIRDDAGEYHRIKAFAYIDSLTELAYAVYLFGACGVGCYLPKGVEDDFAHGRPWTDTSGDPEPDRGHYMPVLARNHNGWVLSTWSDLQGATDDWLRKYWVGGLCFFSLDYLRSTGVSPEAFNEAQLDEDLIALG